ncbi:MAG: hypothetical protein HZB22_03120 [Deltaproteobacteria bacterium]|nr:hypothetical protein [Deltaproteobacteria bacterium]
MTLVSPGIVGLVSGNAVSVRASYWSTAGAKYGDADKGANDLSQNPNFRDASRTGATWDTSLGGAGTLTNTAAELVKLNGFDSSGAVATYNTAYNTAAFLAYIRFGFTPTNQALKGAGDPADGSPDIGAEAVAALGISRGRIVNAGGFGSTGRGSLINAGGI